MPDEEIRKTISDYLSSHNILTLATVTPDGRPIAHAISYVSEGASVYIRTLRQTRKFQNIIRNSTVSYTVNEDCVDWDKIRGVQIEGKAIALSEPDDLRRVQEMFSRKFPQTSGVLPPAETVFVRISPTAGFFIDYSKGFAHKEEVRFPAAVNI